MNNFTNSPIKGNGTGESSSKKGRQSIGQKLKSFFKPTAENEIDYYHQYIFPHKVNKTSKENSLQKYTNYVPLSKRK